MPRKPILKGADAICYRVLVEQAHDEATTRRSYIFLFDRAHGPNAERFDPRRNERLDDALDNEAYATLEDLASGLVESFGAFTANEPGQQQLVLHFEGKATASHQSGAVGSVSPYMEFSVTDEAGRKCYDGAYLERPLDPEEREYLFHVVAAKLLARYGRAPPSVRPATSHE